MTRVRFVSADGKVREVEATNGSSLMQAATDNAIAEIVAECGGACSCATCHCYIDEAWTAKLPKADEIEQAMLECALEPRENSRLSCQITVSDELDGITVHLPEAQY